LNLDLVADHIIPSIHLDVAARERLSVSTLQLHFLLLNLLNQNIPVTLIQWLVPTPGCETVLGCSTSHLHEGMLRDASGDVAIQMFVRDVHVSYCFLLCFFRQRYQTSTLSMQYHEILDSATSNVPSPLTPDIGGWITALHAEEQHDRCVELKRRTSSGRTDTVTSWPLFGLDLVLSDYDDYDKTCQANNNSCLAYILGNTTLSKKQLVTVCLFFFHITNHFFNQSGCIFLLPAMPRTLGDIKNSSGPDPQDWWVRFMI
jgi:hypothetical protein